MSNKNINIQIHKNTKNIFLKKANIIKEKKGHILKSYI